MKRITIVLCIGSLIGFFAARWVQAQAAHPRTGQEPAIDNYIAMHEFASLATYLQETKQTNILRRFNEYSNVSIASQKAAEISQTVAVLERLRNGHTNEAFELLEGKLNADIVGFAAGYRELPPATREKMSLKPIAFARDYRAKFPFKRYPAVDQGVTEAFGILR